VRLWTTAVITVYLLVTFFTGEDDGRTANSSQANMQLLAVPGVLGILPQPLLQYLTIIWNLLGLKTRAIVWKGRRATFPSTCLFTGRTGSLAPSSYLMFIFMVAPRVKLLPIADAGDTTRCKAGVYRAGQKTRAGARTKSTWKGGMQLSQLLYGWRSATCASVPTKCTCAALRMRGSV